MDVSNIKNTLRISIPIFQENNAYLHVIRKYRMVFHQTHSTIRMKCMTNRTTMKTRTHLP